MQGFSYPDVILSPSLPAILNEVKNLPSLRIGSAGSLQDSPVAMLHQDDTRVNGYYFILF